MNKQNSNIFLEVSNNTIGNVDEKYFIKIFQKLKKKLLEYNLKNKLFINLTVSLVVVDNDKIRNINSKYRHQDKVTDVLSFEFFKKDNFILPENNKYLGEIFISYPEAIRISKNIKISLEKELALLFIHGLLHLLGYDHEKNSDKKQMQEIEKLFLNEINAFF